MDSSERTADAGASVRTASYPIEGRLDGKDWSIIIILFGVAVILRFASLGHASLWFDELWTWRVCDQPNLAGLFQKLKEDIHLPSYFLITYGFIKAFGNGEAALRAPAAIFGSLSVPAVYVLGRRILGRFAGAGAAVYLCFGEVIFYYGQEARPYSMMMFLGIVSSYLWYQLYERIFVTEAPAGRLALGLWTILALSCLTHYYCVLLTIFQFGIFGYFAVRRSRGRRVLAVLAFGLLLIGAAWAPVLLEQMRHLFSWTQQYPFADEMKRFLSFTFGGLGFAGTASTVFSGVVALVPLLFAFTKGGKLLLPESKREYDLCLILVMLWFLPMAFSEAVSLTVKPILVDRYLIFCVPFAALALAFQIQRLSIPTWARASTVLLLCLAPSATLQAVSRWYTQPERKAQGDWRRVADQIQTSSPKEGKTAVLAVTERLGVERYYFDRLAPGLILAGEASKLGEVEQAIRDVQAQRPDHVWLFFGQCQQPEQKKAYFDAYMRLQEMYGQARISLLQRGVPMGALLFDVKH
jgi:hypothetical protein